MAHACARFLLLLAAVLLVAGAARAAPPAGVVEGVARDALQRPLAGVELRLEAPDGRIAGRATSGAEGGYRFTGVAPGVYSVVAEQQGFEAATAVVSLEAGAGASADLTLASKQALDLSLTAKKLAEARANIEPRIGATTYTLSNQAIQTQPGGDNLPLNQTLLQVPDVSQDSFGQIHLRNDHANVQYRIDGVILPEGISFFGQSLTSRFASSIDVITGSLPAQYGLYTTGIVDITTKSGVFEPGGSVGVYGGSHGWLEPSAEYAGSVGHFNYFVTGDYTQNGIGIENPTRSYNPIHDGTQQGHGFAYLEDIIDATSKVSAFFGIYQAAFQIPNNPGQIPVFAVGSTTSFDSTRLNENQTEKNDYAGVSYLKATEDYDFQLSAFERYSQLAFTPDPVGDLIFNGIAQNAKRTDVAEGFQGDGTYRIAADHTLRYGMVFQAEHAISDTNSLVLHCLTPDCSSTGTTPLSVVDDSAKTAFIYGAYLQDEWKALPTVTVNYGARFDGLHGFTANDQLSPRLNTVWKPDSETTLHAGYSRYFTPPQLELISGETISKFAGTTGFPAGYTPASPPRDGPILPERSNYFDVGAEHEFLPGLKLGVDGFYKIARDLIDEGQFGAPIILSVFNYAHANVYGIEGTGSYNSGNWSIYGNLAVGRERATQVASQQFNFTPAQLAFIASHYIYTDHSQWITGSGGVAYTWQGTRFSSDMIYGSGLRQANTAAPNGGTVPRYVQVNFGVSHRFADAPGGPVELSLNLINAFDKIYEIRSGTGVGVFAPQFGPRRTIFAGIKKEF